MADLEPLPDELRESKLSPYVKGLLYLIGGFVLAGIGVLITYLSYQSSTDGKYILAWGPVVFGLVGVVIGIGLLLTGGKPMTAMMKRGLYAVAAFGGIALVVWCIWFVFGEMIGQPKLTIPPKVELDRQLADKEAEQYKKDVERGMIVIPEVAETASGGWYSLSESNPFPAFLGYGEGKLFYVADGVAFEGHSGGIIFTRDEGYLASDFVLDAELEVAFADPEQDSPANETWIGIGSGEMGTFPNDSVFLRIEHPKTYKAGILSVCERENPGSSPMMFLQRDFELLKEAGTIRVRVEKRATALRFSVDTNTDGPFSPMFSEVVPDPEGFLGSLKSTRQRLFIAGSPVVRRVRITRLETREELKNPRTLRISSAKYIAGGEEFEVTDRLTRLIENNSLFLVDDGEFIDPVPEPLGSHYFKVRYAIDDGSELEAEGGLIYLNPNIAGWNEINW